MNQHYLTPVTVAGSHIVVRPLEMSDIDPLFEAGNDPDIWQYMPVSMRTRSQLEMTVEDALDQWNLGNELPFTVILKATNAVIGTTRFLDVSEQHKSLEIGWTWLSRNVHGTGINTECKYLLLRHCFETLDCIRVQLKTDSRNERSQRAIEKLGAVKEGVLRCHRILPDGYVRDTVVYSILRTEWPQVKNHLELVLSAIEQVPENGVQDLFHR